MGVSKRHREPLGCSTPRTHRQQRSPEQPPPTRCCSAAAENSRQLLPVPLHCLQNLSLLVYPSIVVSLDSVDSALAQHLPAVAVAGRLPGEEEGGCQLRCALSRCGMPRPHPQRLHTLWRRWRPGW